MAQRKIINAADIKAFGQQIVRKLAADKAGNTGNEMMRQDLPLSRLAVMNCAMTCINA